jgi:hypothetical protein
MFQVEADISIPKGTRPGRRGTTFPFSEMGVGHSFLIPFDTSGDEGKKLVDSWRRKVLNARNRFNAVLMTDAGYGGNEIETRTAVMSDGLRVWRTA